MSHVTCAVRGCRSRKLRAKRVSYHVLPADPNRISLWEEAVGRSLPSFAHICSAHFRAEDYRPPPLHGILKRRLLKNTAVPSVFKRTNRSKVLQDIPVAPSVDNVAITDDLGANVEVSELFGTTEAYKLAPCKCASRQRAGTSEVVTQTRDDLKDTIPNASVLSRPHDEHAYASRWCPPTCVAAGTQVNLFLFKSSKKDRGSQTDIYMYRDYVKKVASAHKKASSENVPTHSSRCRCRFGYTGRTLSSYGRRIGHPSRSKHSWPQKGCCCCK